MNQLNKLPIRRLTVGCLLRRWGPSELGWTPWQWSAPPTWSSSSTAAACDRSATSGLGGPLQTRKPSPTGTVTEKIRDPRSILQ